MTHSSSTRREFLKGRSVVQALEEIGKQAAEPGSTPLPAPTLPPGLDLECGDRAEIGRQSAYLEHYSKPAMATQFELMFNMSQYPESGNATAEAFELIDELEDQMTVYRDHSAISQLNATAFDADVAVELRLFSVLQMATEIGRQTAGAFDITSGQLSALWGFEQRQGAIPTADAIEAALRCVGSSRLVINDQARTVRFKTQGVKINLGGIGKGYALDRVASLLRTHGVKDFAVHGGQSSVICGGVYLTAESASTGWPIGLTHPIFPDVRLAHFNLRDRALGTSGSGRQGFFHQGKRYGHIVDPRTGWPANHFLSTTVISSSAALSDALATAFFVMDEDAIEAYCRSHPDVSAVLISGDPQSGKSPIELVWFNLTDDDWQQHNVH